MKTLRLVFRLRKYVPSNKKLIVDFVSCKLRICAPIYIYICICKIKNKNIKLYFQKIYQIHNICSGNGSKKTVHTV